MPSLDLASVPFAAILFRDEIAVAVNPAYVALMGRPAEEVVGRSVGALISGTVAPLDQGLSRFTAQAQAVGSTPSGHVWLRVTDGQRRERTLQCFWEPGQAPNEFCVFLVDADQDLFAKRLTEALARSGGELVRCDNEQEVLIRSVDALAEFSFTATVLLIKEGEALLAYGPSRSARNQGGPATIPHDYPRPPKSILTEVNPGFAERRAAFFQDGFLLMDRAFQGSDVVALKQQLPGRRMVQAPLFVNEAAYGALVVTSDGLTPALAASLEMYAGLICRAVENVRLKQVMVAGERLAAIGEAAALMAHEVRNPLAAILNAVALMSREPLPPSGEPLSAELRRIITEEAGRLERLVADLLDLGRPLQPRLKETSLSRLAEECVATLVERSEVQAGRVRVTAEALPASVDAELAKLALLNVLRNAVQASPKGAEVVVTGSQAAGWVELRVDDAGPGIGAEVGARMFEPLFTTRATGTGIGLAVVRRVMEAHHGSVAVEQSPAGGARIGLRFPVVS